MKWKEGVKKLYGGVTEAMFKRMSLTEQTHFLMINKDYPNCHLLLKNIEKKIKQAQWLKREVPSGINLDDEIVGPGVL